MNIELQIINHFLNLFLRCFTPGLPTSLFYFLGHFSVCLFNLRNCIDGSLQSVVVEEEFAVILFHTRVHELVVVRKRCIVGHFVIIFLEGIEVKLVFKTSLTVRLSFLFNAVGDSALKLLYWFDHVIDFHW